MASDPIAATAGLEKWRDATARIVLPNNTSSHTLHSYFNHCPESPDGRWVLMFVSQQQDAHLGDVVILERETGKSITLAANITAEDAHRQAYQQWVANGKHILFQNLVNDHWQIERVDPITLERQVISRDRLMGWSQPTADMAMLYPPHWEFSDNRDIEFLDIHTGQVRKAVLADDVCAAVEPLIDKLLPGTDINQISLFFPILSPDESRVMFKLALPTGNGFQHAQASKRVGLIVWDLARNQLVAWREQWGHPAWHPDSRQLVNVQNELLDAQALASTQIHELPAFYGSHPSISPDGLWYVSDSQLHPFDGKNKQWGIALASMQTGQWRFVHRSETVGHGTTSWRPPHPHPTFNAQSNRLYFNVNLNNTMQLHVLESHV